jgi:diguanylate cyclase (GGDEF)-like protein/PAS domain S-box-containing protein
MKREYNNMISGTPCVYNDPLRQPEAQELVTSLLQSAGTAIYILEADRFQYVNESFEEVSGYTAREIAGTSLLDIVHPDDRETLRKHLTETIKGTNTHRPHVHRLIKKNGDILWILGKIASAQYRSKEAIIGCFIDISQSKQTEEELKSAGERLKILFEFAPDAYYLRDLKGTFVDGNRAAEELTGYSRKELIGESFMKLKLLPREQLSRAARLLARNTMGYATGPDELTLIKKNGDPVVVEIRTYPVKIKGKAQVLGIARDITVRKRVEQELQKQKHALGERVKELNCLYEISRLQTATGLSLPVLLQKIVRLIPPAWQYPEHTCARIVVDDQVYVSKDYKETGEKQTASFSTGEEQKGIVEVFYRGKKRGNNESPFLAEESKLLTTIARHLENVIERKSAEEKLTFLANHDTLTGLPNRILFNDRLNTAIAGARRTGQQLAVFVIDMDRFKYINDTFGHATGDLLLGAVGRRFTDTLRKSDTIARMGGDEFFILAAIAGTPYAGKIARKILNAFQEPFELDGNTITITLSIGIALYPQDGKDAQTLEKEADAAMYRAKELGRNRYHIHISEV